MAGTHSFSDPRWSTRFEWVERMDQIRRQMMISRFERQLDVKFGCEIKVDPFPHVIWRDLSSRSMIY